MLDFVTCYKSILYVDTRNTLYQIEKSKKKENNTNFPVKITLDHNAPANTVMSYVNFNDYIPEESDYILRFKKKIFSISVRDILRSLSHSGDPKKIKEVEKGIKRLNILVMSKPKIKILARCELFCKAYCLIF